MLSILIPTKDYDCHRLIKELHRQGQALDIPFEILVGEDGTSAANLNLNNTSDNLPNYRRIVKTHNIGRAKMRNLLALESRYSNLIFIDSDAIVEKSDFLAIYTEALKSYSVVCGGLYHADKCPNNNCSLRYRYEKETDKKRDALTRSKAPYDRFSTFNFAIKKDIFVAILFDDSITRYGHEDTLFGKELEKRGIKIKHIENRLLHNGLEDNATFLAKTEQALFNLKEMKDKIGETPLLIAVHKLQKFHLEGLFMAFWKRCKGILKKNLLGNKPSLKIFNIYKLGYYISLQNRI
ncbi:MAG: glycosyltransferase [Bacteroidaceae bacterium]|nr:glycosyltransferase [Bacteroidaceae bacterium]